MALNFPKYWARGNADGISCWWWSERSAEEAKQLATARATDLAERWRQGIQSTARGSSYGYGDRPLREQVLEELRDSKGTISAVLTRNVYGSLVLNTDGAMFVDIDLPNLEPKPKGFFQTLFGRSAQPEPTVRMEAVQRICRWIEGQRRFGARLYETKAGLRLLLVHDTFDPTSSEVSNAFKALQADPLYQKLCERQRCFRARVSPKPWRCGAPQPPHSWPFVDPDAEAEYATWLQSYSAAASKFASCRFLKAVGHGEQHPDLVEIIKLHDRLSAANSSLPLA